MVIATSEQEFTLAPARKRLNIWPRHVTLREWQQRAFKEWLTLQKKDFLLVSTPGGGKTIGALRIIHHALGTGLADRVVVVVPTEHLRRQWADAAHAIGLSLDPRWSNSAGREMALDYHGVVVSYQQISYAPSLFDLQCCEERTLVVFDEIHHAADQLSWGDSLREAFSRAELRLALSGTPFRSDAYPIPFVEYEEGALGGRLQLQLRGGVARRGVQAYLLSYTKRAREVAEPRRLVRGLLAARRRTAPSSGRAPADDLRSRRRLAARGTAGG
jgi:superfamily II DNA or RNA helicase